MITLITFGVVTIFMILLFTSNWKEVDKVNKVINEFPILLIFDLTNENEILIWLPNSIKKKKLKNKYSKLLFDDIFKRDKRFISKDLKFKIDKLNYLISDFINNWEIEPNDLAIINIENFIDELYKESEPKTCLDLNSSEKQKDFYKK